MGKGVLQVLRVVLAIAFGLVGWSASTQAQVQPMPACDSSLYLTQTVVLNTPPTELIRFDTSSDPFGFTILGSAAGEVYNGTAFNPLDNYLYAIRRTTNILLRIGRDGSVQQLGAIQNLPVPDPDNFPAGYTSGEIDPIGNYYVRHTGPNNNLYRINISNRTAVRIPTSLTFQAQDLAWHNDRLYAVGSECLFCITGPLYEINPATGQTRKIGSSAQSPYPDFFGAMFGATNGVFGVNNDGGFYQFDTITGIGTMISDIRGTDTNDGAKCVTTSMSFPADLAISVDDGSEIYTAGDEVVYTIAVSNLGPFEAPGSIVNAPLPSGIPSANWTCSSGGGGGSCSTASGVGAINNISVNLPVGGSVTFTQSLSVPDDHTGELVNVATVDPPSSGVFFDPNLDNNTDDDVNITATILVSKSAIPSSGTAVSVEDTLDYTLTVDVDNAVTGRDVVLTDTLDNGLDPGPLPNGCSALGQQITCTLAAGAAIGSYTFAYSATVNEDATTEVDNSVITDTGDCGTCITNHPVDPTISVNKSASPASGTAVSVGDIVSYTLTVDVGNAVTDGDVVLIDTLGEGLDVDITSLPSDCSASGQEITCTLAAGAGIGSHTFDYSTTVSEDATTQVDNSVVTDTGDCGTCITNHPVDPTIRVSKSSSPASGMVVSVGDTLAYSLAVDVANAVTDGDVVLTDTLGEGLDVDITSLPSDCSASGQEITCTLAAGAGIGSHTFDYSTTVSEDATTEVDNSVVTDTGDCGTCITNHPVDPTILVSKSASPASGTAVLVGDTVSYTLTVDVANAVTDGDVVLTDTLDEGLDLGPLPSGCSASEQEITCTLAAGAAIGSHTFDYTATLNDNATTEVDNSVVPNTGVCETCSTSHPVLPRVQISKTSDPEDGIEVTVGDTVTYTLNVTVSNGPTTEVLTLSDTLSDGQSLLTDSIISPPGGNCLVASGGLECTLAVGTAPGVYLFSYQTLVDPDAGDTISNNVVASGGGGDDPDCTVCNTGHPVDNHLELRLVKTAGVGSARIGDLVRYVLTVENVGVVPVTDAALVDTPPPGFNYVEGSITVDDGDDAFELSPGRYPLRIGGLDIDVGEQATIAYVLRVGAGARLGTQINSAVVQSDTGDSISNVATAQVTVETGPLLDDSLIFGTVFDDRDADGWMDSAALTGVRVQGGFASSAYAPPVAGATAPLLQGITLGRITARQSEGDPVERHQIVIRNSLVEPAFTDDFVLTSDQGVTVRMDAAGNTWVEKSGEAAQGLNAAEPTVERRLFQSEEGLVVDYVISNAGIDERGLPGVRLASVEGVLIETDQYGRYHLVDVQGGERGYRNFILKVDPSTLSPDTVFTTENPLVRKITPGVPVRFDFGVHLPVTLLPGRTEEVELALGEVIFAPGSAEVRAEYRPAIARMAEEVDAYGGGEVVITADGRSQALAFQRAIAVRDLLLKQVEAEHAQMLRVTVRTEVHELVGGISAGELLLGTVLFDTDRSEIRPEFEELLDNVAAHLEEMGSGVVAVVGHTDVRASYQYNIALGLRRARSVYNALAMRLSPEVRSRIRVESSDDPTASVTLPVTSEDK
ncbi:OmpA family protein [Microbulbifer sp. VAAF005]|uniref:DUF6923 family protein n=1 Tax=Microbulbifer sp. VAAF005 TaxID=3034230 RepID=UPI0024AD8647|nr:OmpA family protein [Microbulbifer sp. VAAF005]WHI46044.1 OmpA family protein [Microbulbifer sp. VAAF005]